ncbi:sn-glycerol-3-phosphate ABC transporter ATP-binding protein UgpC [uncultured Martelella sp.]|uniref:ABC transporter ATP-binding protein n=1 Tax=uncultured Martelella sp. TaxID=392331 RepID=UPI0029C858F4|nr:sn-glycerol-3-phosphate ABC transporter ATP-binding protein UgpC [uncultured Martelella sp.]
MASITIDKVRKSYGAHEVLHGVSIDIRDGEFVTLVGPSGCGKSTLLRMIAGLEPITGGKLSSDGRVLNDLAPKERDIAMVFQNYALYPHMTVAQNMGFSLRLRKAGKAEFDEKVNRAADILGLNDLLERYPGQLSGGQRQRVAMGRAIVRDPSVFLFDEPLSNLDAKLRVQMRIEIKALHERLKTTTIYVTHDQVEAMTMADKIVVMRDGVIEQMGSPLDLYDDPDNRFVAGFLGSPSMNFLEARSVDPATGRITINDELSFPAGMPGTHAGPVTVGIRPEQVRIEADGLPAKVEALEPMGADTHLVVSVEGQSLAIVLHERIKAAIGEEIRIRLPEDRLYFFEPANGERIRS